MTLGETLKIAREEKGLSIRAFAREAGVSYSYLAKVERDLKVPSVDFLIKINRVSNAISIGEYMALLKNKEDELMTELIGLTADICDIETNMCLISGDYRISELKDKVRKTIMDALREISDGD